MSNPSEPTMGPLVRFNAPEKATASIILLHGVGGTSDTYGKFPPAYHAQGRFTHINFLLLNAPIRNTPYWHKVTGQEPITQSWFDCAESGMFDGFYEPQFWQIVDYIHDLIKNEEAHGIPPERIIVGGFSQGGLVTLGALVSLEEKLAGWIIFASAAPPNWTGLESHVTSANKNTPVFHGHGLDDHFITPDIAAESANRYKKLGYDNYTLKLYPGMQHQVDFEQNDLDVAEWVAKIIPKI